MNAHDVDERIRSALDAWAHQVTESDLREPDLPGTDRDIAPRWTRRWLPPLLAAAAVIAVLAGVFAAVSMTRGSHAPPAHTPPPAPVTTPAPVIPPATTAPPSQLPSKQPTPATTPPATTPPATTRPATTPPATTPPATTPPGSKAPAPNAGFDLGYQPLWPFATFADAQTWQASNRSGGHQPWHLDAAQTALSFTNGFLGFTELDTITSRHSDSLGEHVGVGYRDPNGTARTAAVLHLVRFGTDSDSPWEVVGSDDTTFSLETPAYGSAVTSPVTMRGHITGVDESISAAVRAVSSAKPLGQVCCSPAGGDNWPWSVKVPFSGAPSGTVLTLVASTGGHLLNVERFAIQGVRAR